MKRVLVSKNPNKIIISQSAKRLIIDKDDELFENLKELSKNEIIEWFLAGR